MRVRLWCLFSDPLYSQWFNQYDESKAKYHSVISLLCHVSIRRFTEYACGDSVGVGRLCGCGSIVWVCVLRHVTN